MVSAPWVMRRFAILAGLVLLPAGVPFAQDGPSTMVSDGPVGQDSRPVGEDSGSVSDSSERGMLSGPLGASSGRVGAGSRGMLSPSIGEASVGSVRSDRPVFGGASITTSSTGGLVAQPSHFDRPVSEGELHQIQEQLRAIEPLPE